MQYICVTCANYPFYWTARNLQRLKDNWAVLPKGRTGKVIRGTGDFAVRKGQCLEPAAVVDMYPFTVTHKWIHFLDFDVKVSSPLLVML